MVMSDIQITLQDLIDNAVKEGVAPGFQCTVFKKDQVIFNGTSGYASLPSESNPAGKPMAKESILWIASSTKLVTSLIALNILEKGLIPGISLADLDNPDALSKIVPEFAPESGSLITKIIEGFEEGLGPDGKKIMKLRNAKNRVTLRHLLTHSSGMGYPVTNSILWELMVPGDGSKPHFGGVAGPVCDLYFPLVFEPGTDYHYGFSTSWLGQFLVRGTGKHLRRLLKEIITEPLQITAAEMDLWLPAELQDLRADLHVRDEKSLYGFQTTMMGLDLYTAEDGPVEGMAYLADQGLFGSVQAYSKVLQAVATKDSRILSSETWDLALKDDLGPRGIKVTYPDIKALALALLNDVPEFSKTVTENGTGMNLLSCRVALSPTLSGRPTGSFGWGGMTNNYYFVDPNTGLGAVLGAHYLPYFDPKMVELRDRLESIIYKTLV